MINNRSRPRRDDVSPMPWMTLGLVLGAGIGMILSILVFEDLAIGMGIGAGVGLSLGAALELWARER